jgi:hypothetical protein
MIYIDKYQNYFERKETFIATIADIVDKVSKVDKRIFKTGGPTAINIVKEILFKTSPRYKDVMYSGITWQDAYASATNQKFFLMPDEETIDRCLRTIIPKENRPKESNDIYDNGPFYFFGRIDEYN